MWWSVFGAAAWVMEVQATVDDPLMYTKPFSVTFRERLVPDSDVMESFCAENEEDVPHAVK